MDHFSTPAEKPGRRSTNRHLRVQDPRRRSPRRGVESYRNGVGGITIENGKALTGGDFRLADLTGTLLDAVFLGGSGRRQRPGTMGEDLDGVDNAVDFNRVCAAEDSCPICPLDACRGDADWRHDGTRAASQSKKTARHRRSHSARRGKDHIERFRMEAGSRRLEGLVNPPMGPPRRHVRAGGQGSRASISNYTMFGDGRLVGTGESMWIDADQIFKAIGQSFDPLPLAAGGSSLALDGSRILVDEEGRTSAAMVWAGGDCTGTGEDLTVTAVAQGRDAAESIHRALTANGRA